MFIQNKLNHILLEKTFIGDCTNSNIEFTVWGDFFSKIAVDIMLTKSFFQILYF